MFLKIVWIFGGHIVFCRETLKTLKLHDAGLVLKYKTPSEDPGGKEASLFIQQGALISLNNFWLNIFF